MELIRFANLECHFGAREVFAGVAGVLNDGERIGLVGANGAGKSSLLRLLAGIDRPYGGSIARAKDMKLGYLAQGAGDETEVTLQQLVDRALALVPPEHWGLRNKTLRTMLSAFGFSTVDYERPLCDFSGGQRAKAALAHVLIDRPDYLIVDEPTNHLDITTVRWLESFVAADKRAYIVVSHDRYFLDRIATRIWEIERGRLHAYAPSRPAYSTFLAEKEARLERERRTYEAFVADRDKRRATIAGLRATHTSSDYSQVRSREKQLTRVEGGDAPEAPPTAPRGISVRLQTARRRRAAGGFAFEASGLAKAFAPHGPLFTDLTLDLETGERLAVVGPNGSGKSTLLKIFTGELPPDRGSVRYNTAILVAYFAQNSHDQLDAKMNAVDAVLAFAGAAATNEDVRGLLGRMRISGDAADKPVGDFSGGEKRRIMLACLMARKADVLLLDEPTNDLDIDSREALESVLSDYAGSIVVVSHDRFLLSRLSDRVLWIENGGWGVVNGGYDAYESSQREREIAAIERAATTAETMPGRVKASRQTPLRLRSQLETQIRRIEREIERLDARAAEIESLFTRVETYEDGARVQALQNELADARARSAASVATWEELLHRREALETT